MNEQATESSCPEWVDIITDIIVISIGFILTNFIFFNYLYDIREYMENHESFYQGVEYLAIIIFLVLFYGGPKVILGLINKFYLDKKCFVYNWNEIPGDDERRLIDFLERKFHVEWTKNAKFEKIDDGKTIRASSENNLILLKLDDKNDKIILEINELRTNGYFRTEDFIIKKIKGDQNVYERCCNKYINFLISVILVSVYVWIVLFYLIPRYVPLRGEEAKMLIWDVFYWFLSLFVINIIFGWCEFRNLVKALIIYVGKIIPFFQEKRLRGHLNE